MTDTSAIHTVVLVYTSPNGYHEDRDNIVAAFTTEDRAQLFIEWANRELERINKRYRDLRASTTYELAVKETLIPAALSMFPQDGLGTDNYHFQYGDEVDVDPMFG